MSQSQAHAQTTLRASYSDRTFLVSGSPNDDSVFKTIVKDGGVWEPHIMNLMAKLVKPTDICFDIGANLGAHTMVLADLASEGKVYAFEPSTINSGFLSANIENNGLGNAVCEKIGLGSTDGNQAFTHLLGLEGCSFISPEEKLEDVLMKAWGQNLESVTETVSIRTLDRWMSENQVDHVNFIKMDVEGSELAVMDGGKNTLSRCRPKLIVELNRNTLMLYYGVKPSDFFARLKSLYSHIYLIHEDVDRPPTLVRSFSVIEPLLDIPGHWWADLLCMTSPISPTASWGTRFLGFTRKIVGADTTS